MNKTYSLQEIPHIAKEIITSSKNKTLLFYGAMGAGKTTLIKEIVKQLGVDEVANSPTFSLVNEYLSRKGETIYHFDFYRIESEEEAYDIGIEEYFYDNNWCFIEWPQKVENLLPLDAVTIYLTLNKNDSRNIQII
ncbi:MAG: tRNA (adenosine(37)-N6)-threonylcarbamoyltransferase complex ATPase subunit type 1 TsaE [Flavobacteriaceae bacterium]|nr:tRNA (adenosine(37)-N6)-threonylcarbamoyltransferase complex ATPase subunit type 1 TsaE [Flavobacteriaceae bacterium]